MDWKRIEPKIATALKRVVAPVYFMLIGADIGVGVYARFHSARHPDTATGQIDRLFMASLTPHYVTARIATLYYAIALTVAALTVLLLLLRAFAGMMDARSS